MSQFFLPSKHHLEQGIQTSKCYWRFQTSRYFPIQLNSYPQFSFHYSEPFKLQARSNVEHSTTSVNSSVQQNNTALHSSEPFLQARSSVESSTTSPVNLSEQQNNTEAESLLSQLPEQTDSNLGLQHHQTEAVDIACQTDSNFGVSLTSYVIPSKRSSKQNWSNNRSDPSSTFRR